MIFSAFRRRYRLSGLNIDRQLRSYVDAGLRLYGLKRVNNACAEFSAAPWSHKKLFAITDAACYNIISIREGFLRAALLFIKKRAGLLIGFAAVIALLCVYSGFIWHIDITGLKDLGEGAVISALNDLGAGKGTPKSKLNLAALETSLSESLPEIADLSITMRGTTLKINLLERVEPEDEVAPWGNALYASEDCVITSVITYMGTPLVKPGDAVKKGQLLIGGYEELIDGTRRETSAAGRVYGKTYVTVREVINENVSALIRTGKSVQNVKIKLFGLQYTSGKEVKPDYAFYESETVIKPAFYGGLLPLFRTVTTIYELEQKLEKTDINVLAEERRGILYLEALSKLPAGAKAGAYVKSLKALGGGNYSLELSLESEKLISIAGDAVIEKPTGE